MAFRYRGCGVFPPLLKILTDDLKGYRVTVLRLHEEFFVTPPVTAGLRAVTWLALTMVGLARSKRLAPGGSVR
jgi:hypothetical protein